jgi:serine/threonine protein phosphatase PrpC
MLLAPSISGLRACRESRGPGSTCGSTRDGVCVRAGAGSKPAFMSRDAHVARLSSDRVGFPAGADRLAASTPLDDLKEVEQAGPGACAFCKYPCKSHLNTSSSGAGEPCGISAFLEDWQADAEKKPAGFDRFYHSKHASGFETAVVSFGGRQGSFWKSENQDSFFVVPIHDANDDAATNPQYALGVFDGHGQHGGVASRVASQAFAKKIESFVKLDGGRLLSERRLNERLIEILFEHTADVVDRCPADFEKSGTTAVVCVVSSDLVTGGWLGDSRAVVGMRDERAPHLTTVIPLTEDHKPDPIRNPKEAQRVVDDGGRIDRLTIDQQGRPVGPYRVFLQDRWVPGLAVSRAFGDYIVRDSGVISKPDINSLPLGGNMGGDGKRVVILGTDGLWDWISNEDAMRVAWSMPSAREAANALAEAAIKNWALYSQGKVCDDVTVAVVFV